MMLKASLNSWMVFASNWAASDPDRAFLLDFFFFPVFSD
jgi:hypothetical protein